MEKPKRNATEGVSVSSEILPKIPSKLGLQSKIDFESSAWVIQEQYHSSNGSAMSNSQNSIASMFDNLLAYFRNASKSLGIN